MAFGLSSGVTGLFSPAGPERRKLKIKDAEQYGWQPKDMLAQIASIYIHLGRADGQGGFARAIAEDERSFRQEMFAEASKVHCMHPGWCMRND